MNLDTLFNAQALAVVGASSRLKTVGNDIIKNLVAGGFAGKIYPINPKIDELYGLRVYHDLSEIPGEVDLVVIAIPAEAVPAIVEVAATKGARSVVVISAGFKEIGNLALEEKLRDVCRAHNIALVGPNCLGVINAQNKMNASFAALMPEVGNIAFMSQSGALCTAVLDYAEKMAIGFSKFVSIGNKADVDEVDLIRYLHTDPQTKVVALYVEQLSNASEIIETLIELNKGSNPKPVVILKSGRTAAGAGAIASHTGSLSGGDNAYEALFAQAGIIRANTIEDLFNFAQVFCKNEQTVLKKIAVLTNAGGPGVLTADEVIKNGFEMATLSEATTAGLKAVLPPAANVHNPVDVLGDAVAIRYRQALELLVKDPGVDGLIILLTPQSMTEIEETAQAIIEVTAANTLATGHKKPVVVSFMGQKTVAPGVTMLQAAEIMTTTFPEPAAASLAALSNFTAWTKVPESAKMTFTDVDRDTVAEIFRSARASGQTSFPEAEAMAIFRAYGLPTLIQGEAHSATEAVAVCEQLSGQIKAAGRGLEGVKFAMKIVSPEILHKSDVGGVILNVTAETVAAKYEEMMKVVAEKAPAAHLSGVLLMEMAPEGGVQFILGASKAPGLGTMLMAGLGGIYVEILKDVSFAFAPLTEGDALSMLERLKSAALLKGARGGQPLDVAGMVECLGRLSQLVTDFPEITELDLNPLWVLPSGVMVLDGRILL